MIRQSLAGGKYDPLCTTIDQFGGNCAAFVSFAISEAKKHQCYLLGTNFQWDDIDYHTLLRECNRR